MGQKMLESAIYFSLLKAELTNKTLVRRFITITRKFQIALNNFQICQLKNPVSKNSEDDLIVIAYEFYLLARKFESIPTYAVEVFLNENADRLKTLAVDGKLSDLIDLM